MSDACGKTFSQVSQMYRHVIINTEEKQYVFGVCEKAFAQASYLNKHVKNHTREKSYECKPSPRI